MATIGYATLPIIPTVSGITSDLSKQIGAPLTAAGRRAGQDAGAAITAGINGAQVEKAGSNLGSKLFGGVMSAVKGAAAAGGVGAALFGGAALKTGLDRLVTIQDSTAALTTIMGDAGQAGQLLDEIKKTVNGTPFNFDQFATAGKNLVAMNVPAEKVPGYLTAIGEAAAASGKGAEGVDRVTTTFGKMAATGKVALDQVWSISEAGVPALQILANHYGKTTTEMQAMISDGAVPAGEAMDALSKGIMEGSDGAAGATKSYAGTMAGLRETFSGSLGGMKAAVARFGAAFLGPWMPLMTKTFQGVGGVLDSMAPKVQAFSEKLANSGAIQRFTDNLTRLPELFGQIGDTFALFIGTVRGTGADVDLPWMNTVIDLGVRTRSVIDSISSAFGSLGSATSNSAISPSLDSIASSVDRVSVGASESAGALSGLGSAFSSMGSGGLDIAKNLMGSLTEILGFMADHTTIATAAILAMTAAYVAAGPVNEAYKVAMIIRTPLLALQTVQGFMATSATTALTAALNANTVAQGGNAATTQRGIIATTAKKVADLASAAATGVATAAQTAWNAVQNLGVLGASRAAAAMVASKVAMVAGSVATGVATAAQWALNAAMSANPIGLIVVALGALVAAVVVAYQNSETFRNIVQAAWQGIQDAVSFAWSNIISPVLGFFGDRIGEVGRIVSFFYDNVVKPYFELVGTVISTVVDGAKSAFGSFTDALGRVGNFFSDTVNGIQSTWASLRGHLAKPINFMIATVWNDGILKAWNTVADFLPGLSPAAPLAGIPEHATGGRISGPGTGTSDDVLMWGSNSEHMLTAREVQLAGGHNAVYAIRDMIMRGVPFSWDGGQIIRDLGRDNVNAYGAQVASKGVGNVDPQGMFDWMLPKYKDGGEIRPAWESQLENGHRAAKMRNGNPYTWGHEDCSGYMSMIADAIINGGDGIRRWATGSFPGGQPWVPGLGKGFSVGVHDNPGGPGGGHTAGTLTGVGPYSTVNVESGGAHGNVAYGGPAAGADSGQFVGVSPGQYHLAIGADGAFESGGGGGGPSPQQKQEFLQRKIAEIFDKGLNPIKDSIAGAIGSPPPSMLGIPPKFLDTGRDKVSGFLAEKALGLGELLSSAWDKAKDLGSKLTFGLFDQGGLASGTGFMPKNVIAPERVLSPAETKAWELLVPHLVSLAPALEHFESVVTSPAFTSAQSLLVDGQFTPGLRESFGVEESSPIVNAVLGVRDQLKGIVPDLFGTPETSAESFGAVEPPASSEPVGGSGVADAYGDGTQASPEGDKWAEWANGLNEDVKGLFSKENLEEMLSTVVGVGLGGYRGGGDTFNLNGNSDTQVAKVIQRNQRRRSLASQRSGGFGR